MSKKVYISREFHFEAAHHIPNHKGACANLHGHTYKGEVTVSSKVLDDMGMVMDYSDLNAIIKDVIVEPCDHTNLDNIFDVSTAENMVLVFWGLITKRLRDEYPFVKLEKVDLRETQHSRAAVCAD